MSVSASGGTGQVATSVSCFGGLGQLYRVKVWAVSGPNISRALNCLPDGQCREEIVSTNGIYYRISAHCCGMVNMVGTYTGLHARWSLHGGRWDALYSNMN